MFWKWKWKLVVSKVDFWRIRIEKRSVSSSYIRSLSNVFAAVLAWMSLIFAKGHTEWNETAATIETNHKDRKAGNPRQSTDFRLDIGHTSLKAVPTCNRNRFDRPHFLFLHLFCGRLCDWLLNINYLNLLTLSIVQGLSRHKLLNHLRLCRIRLRNHHRLSG